MQIWRQRQMWRPDMSDLTAGFGPLVSSAVETSPPLRTGRPPVRSACALRLVSAAPAKGYPEIRDEGHPVLALDRPACATVRGRLQYRAAGIAPVGGIGDFGKQRQFAVQHRAHPA